MVERRQGYVINRSQCSGGGLKTVEIPEGKNRLGEFEKNCLRKKKVD